MPVPLDEAVVSYGSLALLFLAVVLSILVVTRYSDGRSLFAPLRERFVLGIPWGTVIVIAAVYAFFYLVQGGGRDGGPLVTAFRSWSFWYPQGLFASSFSHASHSHLIGNLLGTLAFAPVVEYAWGHYPSTESSTRIEAWKVRFFGTPAGRITVFVAGVFLAGILGAMFVPGAIIGFSGVVFALAGFALVARPLLAVGAILALQAIRLFRRSLLDPLLFATAEPRFVSPSWADTALQGHLFGLLLGALAAVWVLRRRKTQPKLRYIWFAVLVFAVTRSMYAIYWYRGADQFVLYQALGTAGVLALASLVALAALPDNRPLSKRLGTCPQLRTVAAALLVVALVLLGVSGAVYNAVSVSPGDEMDDGIEIEDYTVAYVTDVEDQYIGAVEVPYLWDGLSVNVSGVVVASDERNAWALERSSNRLAFDGQATIPVGGATWRETVSVDRTEWSFVDGNGTYQVYGTVGEREGWSLLHQDSPAVADLTLSSHNLSIEPATVTDTATERLEPTPQAYELVVTRNDSVVATEPIPPHNESISVADLTFERIENDLVAKTDGTRIRLAEYRTEGR